MTRKTNSDKPTCFRKGATKATLLLTLIAIIAASTSIVTRGAIQPPVDIYYGNNPNGDRSKEPFVYVTCNPNDAETDSVLVRIMGSDGEKKKDIRMGSPKKGELNLLLLSDLTGLENSGTYTVKAVSSKSLGEEATSKAELRLNLTVESTPLQTQIKEYDLKENNGYTSENERYAGYVIFEGNFSKDSYYVSTIYKGPNTFSSVGQVVNGNTLRLNVSRWGNNEITGASVQRITTTSFTRDTANITVTPKQNAANLSANTPAPASAAPAPPAESVELPAILEKINGDWVDRLYYDSPVIDERVVYPFEFIMDPAGVVGSIFPITPYVFGTGMESNYYYPLKMRLLQGGTVELTFDISKPVLSMEPDNEEYVGWSDSAKQYYVNHRIVVDARIPAINEIKYFIGNKAYDMVRFDYERDPGRYQATSVGEGIRLAWNLKKWSVDIWTETRIRIYRSEAQGEKGELVKESDRLKGLSKDDIYSFIDTAVEQGKIYYYSLWPTEFNNGVQEREPIQFGDSWQMVVDVDKVMKEEAAQQYIYDRPTKADDFKAKPAELKGITDEASAKTAIYDAVAALTDEQKESGDALDDLALYIETAARKGANKIVTGKVSLNASVLSDLTDIANNINGSTADMLENESFGLLRNLRTCVTIKSDERKKLNIDFPDDVSSVYFDNVTVEADFVSVTINKDSIKSGGEIEIKKVSAQKSDKAKNNGSGGDANDNGSTSKKGVNPFEFWSVGVILLILIAWGVLAALKKKPPVWIMPTLCVLALAINGGTYFLNKNNNALEVGGNYASESDEVFEDEDCIEVTMNEGVKATVSLPATGGDKDFLVLLNENGEQQYSKYNPITETIDARVKENGVYTLKEKKLDFTDIEKKNALMQEAILQLTSKGIMSGTTDGFFYPDKMITRAELVSAIVRAFDLLDVTLESGFADLDKSDWYYSAAATAEKEGLINGFDDNTFRGDSDMPKDQLVVVSANTLMERMGYKVPMDIEAELIRYLDREYLAQWSVDGIALATQSNIMIYRTDSMFQPKSIMTRGDAAIVLYRVFNKIW